MKCLTQALKVLLLPLLLQDSVPRGVIEVRCIACYRNLQEAATCMLSSGGGLDTATLQQWCASTEQTAVLRLAAVEQLAVAVTERVGICSMLACIMLQADSMQRVLNFIEGSHKSSTFIS